MNFDVLRQKILEKAIRGELVPQLQTKLIGKFSSHCHNF